MLERVWRKKGRPYDVDMLEVAKIDDVSQNI